MHVLRKFHAANGKPRPFCPAARTRQRRRSVPAAAPVTVTSPGNPYSAPPLRAAHGQRRSGARFLRPFQA
ncbi:hypothetical protein N234_33190 [Ralstonia pickettii DTP0602]|nr:hypothetical protein N234_33190 [Ralstonia pickettii DTP0602]